MDILCFFQLFYHYEAFSSTEEDSFAYLYQVSYHSSLQLHSCSFRLRFGYIFISIFFFSFNALRLANMQLVLRFYELDIIVTGSTDPHARSAAIHSNDEFSLRTGFSYCFFSYFDYVKNVLHAFLASRCFFVA